MADVIIENAYGPINLSPRSLSVQHTITGKLVKTLATIPVHQSSSKKRSLPPIVKEKLVYNNVAKEKWTILKYTDYGEAIENAYSQVELDVSNGKMKALSNLNDLYCQELSNHGIDVEQVDMELLRRNSDNIFRNVCNRLRDFLLENDQSLGEISHEELAFGVNLVVAHGFVECIVLEGPR